jgi:type IV secretion system protein VirD4
MNRDFKKSCVITAAMLTIFLMACFLATQFTSIQFKFDSRIGKPIIQSLHLYNPFDFWKWVYYFGDIPRMSHSFKAGWLCIVSSIAINFCFAGWINFIGLSQRDEINTHGSAHFATGAEVRKSGLLPCYTEPAVYVGAYQDEKTGKVQYLKDGSVTHVFVFAPSRSGKGVGLIIPTLLSYTSSVIISDFKLENWYLTSGFRRMLGHKVLKFDPTCTDSSAAQFNPLCEIRHGQHEVRDAQLIADMLVDPDGKSVNDHWSNAANALLVSVILHVLYAEEDKSLAGVRKFLSDPSRTDKDTFERMLKAVNEPAFSEELLANSVITQPTPATSVIASGAREMLNKSEGERSGIISTALTYLKLYRDPIMAQNTRGHDFSINDIVYHEKPVSLYLGIPPSDIGRMMPFMRLMLQMILSRLTESLEINSQATKRRQLLLMLDEFPQFGRLPFFERALSYSSGYNIRAYLISQDMQQIYKEYGRDQSIVSNCGIRIAYAPNTLETAKHLSEALGFTTLRQTHINYSGQRFEWLLRNVSVSEHDIKRPLLTPDELTRLPQDIALIFKNGIAPIYGRKIYYYRDPIFKERAGVCAPEISDKLNILIEKQVAKSANEIKFNWLQQSSKNMNSGVES